MTLHWRILDINLKTLLHLTFQSEMLVIYAYYLAHLHTTKQGCQIYMYVKHTYTIIQLRMFSETIKHFLYIYPIVSMTKIK